MLLMSASCVSELSAQPAGDRGRHPPHRGGDVQLFAHDAQSGLRDLTAQPRDAHLLEQIVVLDLAAPGRADERVLVRRLLERPRRMTRKEAERGERRPATREQVQRHRHSQPRQVGAGKRQVWCGRQIEVAARRQHPSALAQIARRVFDVLDHGVRQHQIERAVLERQRHAVGQREVEVPHAALAAQPHAGVRKALGGIDADDRSGLFGERKRHPAAAASGVEHASADRRRRRARGMR